MRRPIEQKRIRRVSIFYTMKEFEELKKCWSKSTCRNIPNYIRKLSLEDPVEVLVRNASFDAFVEEIIQLRREMSRIRQLPLTSERENQIIRLQDTIQTQINKIAELCMPS